MLNHNTMGVFASWQYSNYYGSGLLGMGESNALPMS